MSTGIHPSIAGVVLAIVFVVAVVWTRSWLSRARREESPPTVAAPGPVATARVILVLVTDSPATVHALETACLLAKERRAEILLAYIIVVPLSLPLDASIDEMETAGAVALATAREVVVQHGLPIRMVIRHSRSMASGLLATVQERHPDLMVIGVGPSKEDAEWGRMVEKVAERAGCEVIVDRLPESAGPSGVRLWSA